MKSNAFFLVLIVLTGFLTSCSKDDIEFETEYGKSYNAWTEFKKSSNNSYKYVVTGASWIGISWETTITISNGTITQRHFKYTALSAAEEEGIPTEELEWTENESEINTHKNSAAREAITLDDVYKLARQEWLKKRKDAKTYFETNNNGMISNCGYFPNGCMDDCFVGIHISSIEAN